MMKQCIKEFHGFSGSKIYLMKENDLVFVRKEKNIQRNYEKLVKLADAGFLVPRIYDKKDDILEMEYVHGIDIKTYLNTNSVKNLLKFLVDIIEKFKTTSKKKNFYSVYVDALAFIEYDKFLPFTKEQLISRLPYELEESLCHGDLTLENLIFHQDKFYMIDPTSGVYNSWIFDLAKLRQDLDCKWFLRKNFINLDIQLNYLSDELRKLYSTAFDNYLYILMLLRVYKYCKTDSLEHKILLSEIKKLWK